MNPFRITVRFLFVSAIAILILSGEAQAQGPGGSIRPLPSGLSTSPLSPGAGRSSSGVTPQLASPSNPSATSQWLNGTSTYHQAACQGEIRSEEYVGYYGASDGSLPKVGDIYYGHVVFGAYTSQCTPGADAHIQVRLPNNTYFVSNAGQVAVKCWYVPSGGTSAVDVTNDPSASCTQTPTPAGNGWYDLSTRIVANGGIFEMVFPIFSSQTLNGMAGAGTQLIAQVDVSVAVVMSTLPSQWVWVAANPPTISYPTPSYSIVSATQANTTGYTYAHFTAGNVYFDLGTTTAYGATAGPSLIDGTADSYTSTAFWSPFNVGQTYHWRLRFVPNSGPVVYGADQSFVFTGTLSGYALTPSASPPEGGNVTLSPAGGVYAPGTVVNVTAVENSGYKFSGWILDGVAQGTTNPLAVRMDRSHAVTANFGPAGVPVYTLSVSVTPAGGGTIGVFPPSPYPAGTAITLTAQPAANYSFGSWSIDGGPANTTNPLNLTMGANHSAVASFSLAVATVGNGTPGSCTEADLNLKLSYHTPALVFNCGPAPVTIPLTAYKLLSYPLVMDGGSLVTLSGGGTTRLFEVGPGVPAQFRNLTLGKANDTGIGFGCGGAILNEGKLTVDHVTFQSNTAEWFGGAICNALNSTLTVNRSTFSGNSSKGDGGAIHSRGNTTIADSTFSGNSTDLSGLGGAYANLAYLFVTRSTFSGNMAGEGGAILNTGRVDLVNSTLSGNWAYHQGGGVNSGNYLHIAYSTLFGNGADTNGGSLWNASGGSIQLEGTLLGGSTPNNCAGLVALTSLGYNLDSGNSCGLGGPGDLINRDPKVGALTRNGGPTSTHPLMAGSPAIDAGSPLTCVVVDQRGVKRPVDGNGDGIATCDIGAYEFVPPRILMPFIRR